MGASSTARRFRRFRCHWNSTTQSLTSAPVAAESTRKARDYWQRTSVLTTFTGNSSIEVQQAYYRLLNASGQEAAARASLANAQAVQQAAEERLHNGLATLPDVLEARSATAQAQYDLQAVLGAEEIARGDLATALGASAATMIRVQPLSEVPTPESDRRHRRARRSIALSTQRPDLQAEVAGIREADAQRKEARAAFYPSLNLQSQPECSIAISATANACLGDIRPT